MPARIVAATRRTRASRTNCHPSLPMICAEQASGLPIGCGSASANWFSTSLDPDVLGEPARLTCQREVFKFAAEQKRLDTRNDHFCPALRACRRGWCWWRVPASHMNAFHPDFVRRELRRSKRRGRAWTAVKGTQVAGRSISLIVRALASTRHPLELRRAAVRLICSSGARRGRRRDAAAVRPTGPVAHS
jgi:hypothetical protein